MNILKLKSKMVEKGMNVNALATILGVDRSTLYRKLSEVERFTVGEARKIKDTLDLTDGEASEIFFG